MRDDKGFQCPNMKEFKYKYRNMIIDISICKSAYLENKIVFFICVFLEIRLTCAAVTGCPLREQVGILKSKELR